MASLFKVLFKQKFNSPLSFRLLVYILMISACFSLVISASQLYADYRYALKSIDKELDLIQDNMYEPLSDSIWNFNSIQIELLMESLIKKPVIDYVRLTYLPDGDTSLGVMPDDIFAHHQARGVIMKNVSLVKKNVSLVLRKGDTEEYLGELTLVSNLDSVYDMLKNKVIFIVLLQFVKTFFTALLILWIFQRFVIKHLIHMANFAQNISLENIDMTLVLDKTIDQDCPDELDCVSMALNSMQARLKSQKDELSQLIEERTSAYKEAEKSRIKQEEITNNLKNAQELLIQNEKMASLGRLVAGISHELNTPIGNSVTVISFMQERMNTFEQNFKQGSLTKSMMEKYIQNSNEGIGILSNCMQMVLDQIRRFKQVSVDQTSEVKRVFELKEVIESIVSTMKYQINHNQFHVHVDIPDGIMMDSYPGPIVQIISNCIQNCLLHAFDERETGNIWIVADQNDNAFVNLSVRDDGVGMSHHQLRHAFDPFYTTKMGKGGSGLGMNIVHNLVTRILQGDVKISSEKEKGTEIIFHLPLCTASIDEPLIEQQSGAA